MESTDKKIGCQFQTFLNIADTKSSFESHNHLKKKQKVLYWYAPVSLSIPFCSFVELWIVEIVLYFLGEAEELNNRSTHSKSWLYHGIDLMYWTLRFSRLGNILCPLMTDNSSRPSPYRSRVRMCQIPKLLVPSMLLFIFRLIYCVIWNLRRDNYDWIWRMRETYVKSVLNLMVIAVT